MEEKKNNEQVVKETEKTVQPEPKPAPQNKHENKAKAEEKKGFFKKKEDEEKKKLLEENALLKDKYLRTQAEMQNMRRRMEEEKASLLKYEGEDLIIKLLPTLDNFERAIKMDDNDLSDEVSKFLAGFKLIYTNMLNILNQFDVKEISAEGVEFDPEFHHAVLTDHDESKPAGVVLEVLQKGYLYKDRVIRPAMVKVNE